MPRYAFLCTIDETKLDLFRKLRGEHYGFLIAQQQHIVFGGPARVAEGGPPETMIIVAEAASLADAEAFIANEPYNKHGGFKHVAVRPWSQVMPELEPGSLVRTYEAEQASGENGPSVRPV